jgi:zinc protease
LRILPRFAVLAASAGLLMGAGAAPSAPILDASHIQEHTLANGLHVIVKEEHGWGVVALGAYVRSGSLYDPPEYPGVAHFMEHMLFRRADGNSEPSAIVAAVEGSGGQIDASTSRDWTLLRIVTSPQSLGHIWPVLATTLLETDFDAESVVKEQEIILQEIGEREGRAFEVLAETAWSVAYPNHPYGRSVGGGAEGVQKITPEVLTQYHSRFFVPNNIALILVGDVAASQVFSDVQEAFGRYPQQPVEWAPPEPVPPPTSSRVKVEKRDVRATLLAIGFRGPGIRKKRDVCAMDLIYTILGEGRRARFETEVRAKELVTAFQLDFITHRDDGLVLLTAAGPPDKELEARAAIMGEFERLAEEGVAEDELARAKRQLRNSYAFTNEAYSDQVGSMGFYEMIDTYRFAIEYIDAVNAVTAEDIKSVAKRYLDPQKLVLVIFRPPRASEPGGEV